MSNKDNIFRLNVVLLRTMKHLHNTCCNTCFSGVRRMFNRADNFVRIIVDGNSISKCSANVDSIRTFVSSLIYSNPSAAKKIKRGKKTTTRGSPQEDLEVQNTRQNYTKKMETARGRKHLTSNGVDVSLAEVCSPNVLSVGWVATCLDALCSHAITAKRIQGVQANDKTAMPEPRPNMLIGRYHRANGERTRKEDDVCNKVLWHDAKQEWVKNRLNR